MIRSSLSIVASRQKLTYRYDPINLLNWTGSASYTKLSTSYTSIDDGYSVTPITMPFAFSSGGVSSTSLFVSTNGYVTVGSGFGNILSNPQDVNVKPLVGNASDQWLNPGLVMSDGDAQDAWYKIDTSLSPSRWSIKLVVFMGTYQATTTPKSYLIELYKDEEYQWLVTRVKSNAVGNAGPYNAIDVSQPASQQSRVWRGSLSGTNWVYLGTGSVIV
jgi:hypothetical protein